MASRPHQSILFQTGHGKKPVHTCVILMIHGMGCMLDRLKRDCELHRSKSHCRRLHLMSAAHYPRWRRVALHSRLLPRWRREALQLSPQLLQLLLPRGGPPPSASPLSSTTELAVEDEPFPPGIFQICRQLAALGSHVFLCLDKILNASGHLRSALAPLLCQLDDAGRTMLGVT